MALIFGLYNPKYMSHPPLSALGEGYLGLVQIDFIELQLSKPP